MDSDCGDAGARASNQPRALPHQPTYSCSLSFGSSVHHYHRPAFYPQRSDNINKIPTWQLKDPLPSLRKSSRREPALKCTGEVTTATVAVVPSLPDPPSPPAIPFLYSTSAACDNVGGDGGCGGGIACDSCDGSVSSSVLRGCGGGRLSSNTSRQQHLPLAAPHCPRPPQVVCHTSYPGWYVGWLLKDLKYLIMWVVYSWDCDIQRHG